MKFSGKAITREKRKALLNYANGQADECCIGVAKTKNNNYISVARFFAKDKLLFCIVL